ncbi:tyrosyl-trna synthetase : Tyrosine--tRNA ligase OS=Planctomyces brasiliensis (strain ATCC 49424 / DSM 5305 / JCM 21570 / NBRC 103401 / IFAM 1448) GN=Plabr_2772 PE=4 SV=1: tRNA-synt_1b [Gemmata massiliana]|uniref:Tyrosine--tRNA ligase n=1 Tax=Gemmata massiliana TaxID=1210884 RepID=A0A6P2D0U8_9BACT|nr:tyrosine--tRNA ligase [Gemmata massiliana]VTR93704.1 tyrosyl-trna synthetase : Tyrosine--tRNA ligase OS=Planctomyces brasiliensis (strain ATCC 49424 / DSM 5305 / JCM 21570 / NBRC 103401 / IFAM 1448) GN=Plabr_2772 PE=4 SV=1: tRNA-synt_1b [Gemmata massiliana]
MSAFPPVDEQLAVILRGAAQTETAAELKKKLEKSRETGKPLRVKYGIDPTGFDVHLGHTVPLRKLRQFQELGHTAVLIIGTATAAVGDPSGRDASRQGLTPDQIEKNAQTYLTQIAKVVDVTKAEVRPNAEWFSKFGFADVLRLLGHTTIQRMIERDDFTNRIKAGTAIYLHECLYPLMQGWDSVEIRADVELGGTEQLYNLMVGRDLQRASGQEPQICLTMPILRGTDGEKKMGKSVGNYIGLSEPAKDMFGKTMRIPDALMKEWFELLTDRSAKEVAEIVAGHPNEAKKLLGSDIVTFYHGSAAAAETIGDWNKQFSQRLDPDQIPLLLLKCELQDGFFDAAQLLIELGLCKSKSEARRKIQEGAVNYGPDRTRVEGIGAMIPVTDRMIVRLGRRVVQVQLEVADVNSNDLN